MNLTRNKFIGISFLEGFSVLAIEMLVAKMITPFFGASFYVWLITIGVTIAYLALGYFIGSIWVKKRYKQNVLFVIFLLSSVFISSTPLIAHHLIPILYDIGMYSATFIIIMLLLVPLIFIGSTSPVIIDMFTTSKSSGGKISGNFYGYSTIGAITASFLFGFFIIPEFGIMWVTFVLSLFLLICTIILWYEKKYFILVASLFVIYVFSFVGIIIQKKDTVGNRYRLVAQSEGLLGQLKVMDGVSQQGSPQRVLLVNGIPQTRIQNTSNANSDWKYVHEISAYASLKKPTTKFGDTVLLMGFGGGSLAKELTKLGFFIRAVDLDKRMLQFAKEYFYVNDDNIQMHIDDARHYIKKEKRKYNLIVVDVLNAELQPSYLFSLESFKEMKKLLNPDGMLVVNYQATLISEKDPAARAIYKTMIQAGFITYVYATSPTIPNDVYYIGSNKAVKFSDLQMEKLNLCCQMRAEIPNFLKNPYYNQNINLINIPIIVDDKPQLDHLIFENTQMWRQGMIKDMIKIYLEEGIDLFQ